MTKKYPKNTIFIIPLKHDGSLIVDEQQKKYLTDDLCHLSGYNYWFLHGYLQDKFGFDKANMFVSKDVLGECLTSNSHYRCLYDDGKFYLKDGIYDVTVYGVMEKCTAFLWIDGVDDKNPHSPLLQRGVIVLNSDKEGMKDGKRLFETKPVAF